MAKEVESAAMVLSKISRTHLECSICHERYQTPKLLDCLHSFCEKCLVAYKKSTPKLEDILPCPVCRKETKLSSDGVPGLRTNFHLMGMVDDFTLQEKLTQRKSFKLLCELCPNRDPPEAEFRCMDCPFFLCVTCRKVHHRIAATSDHEIFGLKSLKSGTVSLRSKAKDEPPCDKHRGEKKRFYCETCKELICRDCTVVEHREHKFTTVPDAASRFRKATQELIVKVEESWAAHKETQLEMTQMDSQLKKTGSLSHQQVIDVADEEGGKIAKRESDIEKDISRRKKHRMKTLQLNEISIVKPRSQASKSTESSNAEENLQKYSQSLEAKFATIDKTIVTLGQNAATLIQTDKGMHYVIASLKEEAVKDANEDRSKVAASKDKLLSQIQNTYKLRQQVIKELTKMSDAQIQRLRHALDTASDVVKSASDVDFLNLHSVIDNDLQNLLEESPPNLHPGYPKIEFKSSGDTGLGEVVVGATWKWGKDVNISSQVNNICALTGSKVLLQTGNGLRVCDVTSSSQSSYGGSGERFIAMFPDSGFVAMDSSNVRLYDLNISAKSSFRLPGTIKQNGSDTPLGQALSITHYKDKLLAVAYTSWQGILVHDSSDGKVIRQLPVSVKPDFLTSTRRGRLLVAARSPAIIEGIDSRGDSVFTIQPTVEGVPEGKQVSCVGICCDKRDTIYVALYVGGESEVHVHQYSPYANFLGCSILDKQSSYDVRGIAVTEEDQLVLASAYHVFKVYMRKE